MVAKIVLKHKTTGLTVSALIVAEDGTIWDNVAGAFVAVSSIDTTRWKASLISCTEQSTSTPDATGLYIGTVPGGITTTALYSAVFYSGADPDPGDKPIGYQDNMTGHLASTPSIDTYYTQVVSKHW